MRSQSPASRRSALPKGHDVPDFIVTCQSENSGTPLSRKLGRGRRWAAQPLQTLMRERQIEVLLCNVCVLFHPSAGEWCSLSARLGRL
jgi:hypothetical protein